jgi:predicted adenylyl cyclase CyaB
MEEIEVKILDIDPENVRISLKKAGAKLNKNVFQRNFIFSNKLTKSKDLTVRVRQENDKVWLAIKTPKIKENGHETCEEYEFPIDNIEIGEKFLNTLDITMDGIGEAKREYYDLFDCSVEIIKIPKIPEYLEIDGSKINIMKVTKVLGFTEKDFFQGSLLKNYNIKEKFLAFNHKQ